MNYVEPFNLIAPIAGFACQRSITARLALRSLVHWKPIRLLASTRLRISAAIALFAILAPDCEALGAEPPGPDVTSSPAIAFKEFRFDSSAKDFLQHFRKKGYKCSHSPELPQLGSCISTSDTYAGAKATTIEATFIDDKLGRVKISFVGKNEPLLQVRFDLLLYALREKYPMGEPYEPSQPHVLGVKKVSKLTDSTGEITLYLQIPSALASALGEQSAVNVEIMASDYSDNLARIVRSSGNDSLKKPADKDL